MNREGAKPRIASSVVRWRAPAPPRRRLALALALGLAGVPSPASPADLPQGEAALTYQIRSVRNSDPTFSPSTTTEQDVGLRASQELPNYGVLRAEAHWFDPSGAGSERGWTEIGLAGVRLRGAELSAGLGDAVFDASLVPRRFLVLVDPSFAVEGARLDLAAGATAVTLFGGEAVARTGSFATAVDRLGQDVAGVRLRQGLGGRATLSALYLHTEGGGPVGGSRVAARNDSVGVGADVRVWGPLALVGEARYAADADAVGAPGGTNGLSYVAGPLYDRPGLRLEGAAFSLDPTYVPVERAITSADRRGFYGAFNWDAGRALGFFGSAVRSRNNLADDPSLATIETTQLILGGRGLVPAAWPVLVLLRGEVTFLESLRSPSGQVDSTGTSLNVEVSQVIGPWRPVLRGRVARLDDRALGAESTTADLAGELWWQVTRRARLWATAQWVQVSGAGGVLAGSTRYLGRIGGEQRFTAALFVRSEAEVTRAEEVGFDQTRAGASASFGYRHRFFDLFVDLRRNWTDSDGVAGRRTDDLAYLRLTVPLRWGRPVPPAAGRASGDPKGGWGTIEGDVFADLDGDGRRGPGEPGLPGLTVIVDGIKEGAVETDRDGRYRLARVAAGPHSLRLEVRRLPADYDLISPPFVEVVVEQRQTRRVDFVVQPLGQVEGRVRRVVVAEDGAATAAGPAASVSLFLRRGEEVWQTYSDAEGRFAFDNVRAGEYELFVDPAGLPAGAAAEPASRAVVVGIGKAVGGLDFTVREAARPEIRNGTSPPAASVVPVDPAAPPVPRPADRPASPSRPSEPPASAPPVPAEPRSSRPGRPLAEPSVAEPARRASAPVASEPAGTIASAPRPPEPPEPAPAPLVPAAVEPAPAGAGARVVATPDGSTPALPSPRPAGSFSVGAAEPAGGDRNCLGDSPEAGMTGVLLFRTNSARPIEESSERAEIARWAMWLLADPSRRLRLEGHTDRRGPEAYNLRLGGRRAAAVGNGLAAAGAPTDRLHTVSAGEARPCDPANSPSAWARNRRVLIIVDETARGGEARQSSPPGATAGSTTP